MRVLAIDQGTTSTRALVFDGDAPPRLAAAVRHRQIYPRPGWVEHDPLELLANVEACLAASGPVDAIGLANQGESCLAWDAETLAPLSPVIVWQDSRTVDAIEQIRAAGLEDRVRARSGLPLDCYFAAAKLAWIVEHEPAAQRALGDGRLRLGTTDSFLIERLTGVSATDPTTASRTALMNLASLTWDPVLCATFGVPPATLAPIRPTTAGFGAYRGTPLVASVVDQQAALHGHRGHRSGDAKITFGTGAFALAVAGVTAPEALPDGLIATVAWATATETRYALEGGVYDAGAAIEWAMRIGLVSDPAELGAFDAAPAIDRGLVFIPALSGLSCPQWRRDARGLWSGMTTATTRRDLHQSLLEGIALQTAAMIAALDRRVGLAATIAVDGGLSASDYFLQFLADVTGRTIVRCGGVEVTALGCAMLAGHVAGDVVEQPGDRFVCRADAATRTRRAALYDRAIAAAVASG